jgi:threonine aldolase
MIDLRSDTVTRPTAGMLAAMAAAPVGDDVYGEDPTVNALEARVAALLGHEAGLFVTTGSLANLLGVWCLVQPGQEVVCDVRAHIARAEMGAHGALHGITMRTWDSADGVTDAATIEAMITPNAGPYLVSTAAVALENTHNFGGGTVQPYEHLAEVSQLCRDAGVGLHLDGARLWNASAATGIPLADYGKLFDTVNVCFSKGLGAPIGSMLVSSAANIARARVQRKRLGSGWRQAGFLAAAADYAIDHHVPRLADDHVAAAAFAAEVAASAPSAVELASVSTNIVVLDTGALSGAEVAAKAADAGVLVSALGAHMVRAVTHQEVSIDQTQEAGRVVGAALAGVPAA